MGDQDIIDLSWDGENNVSDEKEIEKQDMSPQDNFSFSAPLSPPRPSTQRVMLRTTSVTKKRSTSKTCHDKINLQYLFRVLFAYHSLLKACLKLILKVQIKKIFQFLRFSKKHCSGHHLIHPNNVQSVEVRRKRFLP